MTEIKEKAEFGSKEWMDIADKVVVDVVADHRDKIAGERFSTSYTFTNAPAHLCDDGQSSIGWSIFIDDGAITIDRAERADVDFAMWVDYDYTLPNARGLQTMEPESREEVEAKRQKAIADGLLVMKGTTEGASPAMIGMLVDMHNRFAEFTA